MTIQKVALHRVNCVEFSRTFLTSLVIVQLKIPLQKELIKYCEWTVCDGWCHLNFLEPLN